MKEKVAKVTLDIAHRLNSFVFDKVSVSAVDSMAAIKVMVGQNSFLLFA